MPAPSISTVTTTTRNIPTLTIYEDFDKIIAKEVCFTETGQQNDFSINFTFWNAFGQSLKFVIRRKQLIRPESYFWPRFYFIPVPID